MTFDHMDDLRSHKVTFVRPKTVQFHTEIPR